MAGRAYDYDLPDRAARDRFHREIGSATRQLTTANPGLKARLSNLRTYYDLAIQYDEDHATEVREELHDRDNSTALIEVGAAAENPWWEQFDGVLKGIRHIAAELNVPAALAAFGIAGPEAALGVVLASVLSADDLTDAERAAVQPFVQAANGSPATGRPGTEDDLHLASELRESPEVKEVSQAFLEVPHPKFGEAGGTNQYQPNRWAGYLLALSTPGKTAQQLSLTGRSFARFAGTTPGDLHRFLQGIANGNGGYQDEHGQTVHYNPEQIAVASSLLYVLDQKGADNMAHAAHQAIVDISNSPQLIQRSTQFLIPDVVMQYGDANIDAPGFGDQETGERPRPAGEGGPPAGSGGDSSGGTDSGGLTQNPGSGGASKGTKRPRPDEPISTPPPALPPGPVVITHPDRTIMAPPKMPPKTVTTPPVSTIKPQPIPPVSAPAPPPYYVPWPIPTTKVIPQPTETPTVHGPEESKTVKYDPDAPYSFSGASNYEYNPAHDPKAGGGGDLITWHNPLHYRERVNFDYFS